MKKSKRKNKSDSSKVAFTWAEGMIAFNGMALVYFLSVYLSPPCTTYFCGFGAGISNGLMIIGFILIDFIVIIIKLTSNYNSPKSKSKTRK